MYMPDFEYHAPESVKDASLLLAGLGPTASVLAGGTDLLHKMKLGKAEPRALVSLRRIPVLRDIRYVPNRGLVIGAAATHNDLMESKVILERYHSIADAAHQMASNQIRNLGTIGGNIVNAVPSADLPPILIALGASIRLSGADGERSMPLEDFFTEPASSVIAHSEILTEITIPDGPFTGSRYVKFGLRRSGALAVAGAAVALTVSGGVVREARVALSSSAPKVIRALTAEEFITGKKPTKANLAKFTELVSGDTRPRDSIRGTAEYRRHLAGVLARRAVEKSLESGHGPSKGE